jgi:1-acyl-sn-glycerol-3-phosphate acyltransferase/nucleoside-diphosphate-sugar epimerase
MTRVVVIEPRARLGKVLVERLRDNPAVSECVLAAGDEPVVAEGDAVVYHPPPSRRKSGVPDLKHARRILTRCAAAPVRKVVLLSSAAVYGPTCHNPGLITENRLTARNRHNHIAGQWLELEGLARRSLGENAKKRLTILRPTTVPLRDEGGPLRGVFSGRIALRVPGHDPSIQLLSPEDLAGAVGSALAGGRCGTYNVAPAGVIPLRKALRLAGVWGVPVCSLVQKVARAALSRVGLSGPAGRTDYLRYSWTVSGEKIARELGFVPRRNSASALHDCRHLETGKPPRRWREFADQEFDDFGYDAGYFRFVDRTLVRFLERYYWRVELKGIEQVPARGPAVLVGIHRGFMPFDGVLFTHQVAREVGRVARFLIHPGLVKFPFLHDFMTKHSGVIACNENADYALRRGELLALYPEGIHGAFRPYRDAYDLGKFGRDDYVRMALRHGAPIIPFVTLGSAETFPILGKIEWGWWKRYAEWPFIPLTPTFPLLPVPLPSKWHTLVLQPIHVEWDYPPAAADDDRVVRAIGQAVRGRLQQALTWMRARRRSVFYGSIFGEESIPTPQGVAHPAREIAGVEGR